MTPFTIDYLVSRSQVVAAGKQCESCRLQAASVAVVMQRVQGGRLWFESAHDYCGACADAAADRMHGECHRRLYGDIPPPRYTKGAA